MGDEDFAPLTHEKLCECLSDIQLIVGGGGFAFTRLDCSSKELNHLGNKIDNEVGNYKQLRHVVLSQNKFADLTAVMKLPHLLALVADNNQVSNLECLSESDLPWCQRLDLSGNQFTSLPPLDKLGRLTFASFSANQIAAVSNFGGHSSLIELELQENPLTSLVGLGSLPNLKRLDVSGGQLTSLEGLDAPSLTNLNVSKNQIASLDGAAGVPFCEQLDIRENQLSGDDEMQPELRKLGPGIPKLRSLYISGNGLADTAGDTLKAVVLVCIPQVTVIEEEPVTDEDHQAAKDLNVELLERQAEREAEARAAAEAAAAEAAAAEAAEGAEDG